MNGPHVWHLLLTCCYCGAICTPRTVSPSTGREARAIADCTECDGEMMIAVVVVPALRKGTPSHARPQRQRRYGELSAPRWPHFTEDQKRDLRSLVGLLRELLDGAVEDDLAEAVAA